MASVEGCLQCQKPDPVKKCSKSLGINVPKAHLICRGKLFCNNDCIRLHHSSQRKKVSS